MKFVYMQQCLCVWESEEHEQKKVSVCMHVFLCVYACVHMCMYKCVTMCMSLCTCASYVFQSACCVEI